MAYGQQTAYRVQQTKKAVVSTGWTALEGSTPLANRFAVKVFNVGSAGATRLGLSYNNTLSVKDSSHWLGAGQFVVEPASTGLTLYGRAKLASGITSIRVIVTEYGH
jgi:hypothetical protein